LACFAAQAAPIFSSMHGPCNSTTREIFAGLYRLGHSGALFRIFRWHFLLTRGLEHASPSTDFNVVKAIPGTVTPLHSRSSS
jgi:hypothetical protein